MWRLFLLFFLPIAVISDDNSVEIDGTIGTYRFVMLSENTIGCEASDVSTIGSDKFLLGSVELNLFDNDSGGTVYMNSPQFTTEPADMWRVLQVNDSRRQIKLEIYLDADTTGTAVAPAREAQLYTSDTTTITNERIVLGFYAVDDADNDTTANQEYLAYFFFYWTDD